MNKGRLCRMLTILFLAAVMLRTGAAARADQARPGGLQLEMPVLKDYMPTRGTIFSGPDSGVTGEEYIFMMVQEEEATEYQFFVAVIENDTGVLQYRSRRGETNELRYTFFEPGSYTLYAYRYDADGDIISWTYNEEEYPFVYKQIDVAYNGENALTEAVQAAADACLSENDEFETAVAINDWLVSSVIYEPNWNDPAEEVYYNPEGALLNRHTCVCNGYCRAYQLIARACGLECGRVTGGGHAWNTVKVNGEWYHTDSTWNDTSGIIHLYMGMNDTLIQREHTIADYPDGAAACTSLDDNYFVHTGLWRNLAAGIEEELQLQIDNTADGTIDVDFGEMAYLEERDHFFPGDANILYYNGNFIAYAMSRTLLVRNGVRGERNVRGTFFYDEAGNTLNGTVEEVEPEYTFLIPDGITEIGDEAFAGSTVQTVRIPDECAAVGEGAFRDSGLIAVYVPESVLYIGDEAFPEGTVIFTPAGSTAAAWGEANACIVAAKDCEQTEQIMETETDLRE